MNKSKTSRLKLSILLFATLLMIACANRFAPAQKTLEDYYRNAGIREIKIDSFYIAPDSPDRAYASATLTHNFANRDGNFQKEYLGHILKKTGDTWQVEKKTTYTTKESDALELLAGKKIQPFPSAPPQ